MLAVASLVLTAAVVLHVRGGNGPTPWCPPVCSGVDQVTAALAWYVVLWVVGFWAWLLRLLRR